MANFGILMDGWIQSVVHIRHFELHYRGFQDWRAFMTKECPWRSAKRIANEMIWAHLQLDVLLTMYPYPPKYNEEGEEIEDDEKDIGIEDRWIFERPIKKEYWEMSTCAAIKRLLGNNPIKITPDGLMTYLQEYLMILKERERRIGEVPGDLWERIENRAYYFEEETFDLFAHPHMQGPTFQRGNWLQPSEEDEFFRRMCGYFGDLWDDLEEAYHMAQSVAEMQVEEPFQHPWNTNLQVQQAWEHPLSTLYAAGILYSYIPTINEHRAQIMPIRLRPHTVEGYMSILFAYRVSHRILQDPVTFVQQANRRCVTIVIDPLQFAGNVAQVRLRGAAADIQNYIRWLYPFLDSNNYLNLRPKTGEVFRPNWSSWDVQYGWRKLTNYQLSKWFCGFHEYGGTYCLEEHDLRQHPVCFKCRKNDFENHQATECPYFPPIMGNTFRQISAPPEENPDIEPVNLRSPTLRNRLRETPTDIRIYLDNQVSIPVHRRVVELCFTEIQLGPTQQILVIPSVNEPVLSRILQIAYDREVRDVPLREITLLRQAAERLGFAVTRFRAFRN